EGEGELSRLEVLVGGSGNLANFTGRLRANFGLRRRRGATSCGHPLCHLPMAALTKGSFGLREVAEAFAGESEVPPSTRVGRVERQEVFEIAPGELGLPRLQVTEREV